MLKTLKYGCLSLFLLGAFSTANAEGLTCYAKLVHDWWWTAPQHPEVHLVVKGQDGKAALGKVQLTVLTDTKKPVYEFSQAVSVAAADSVELSFGFRVEPGFYRCVIDSEGGESSEFNIGYEPESVVSLPDYQPDFDEFWADAKAELAKVAPDYQMTLDKEKSTSDGKVYLVSMKSLGGETIKGYLTVPAKKGKYPALVHYMGYGSKPWYPHPAKDKKFVEFVLSSRGQGLCQPENKYGDWITYGLDDKNTYYYKGAFMDVVRALDFVTQLEQVDTRYVFAEGGSQGGAFTLAACALDNRITAAAPWIPFLSDYKDYFRIVNWPADPVLKKQHELGLSDEALYATMSYFDIKNLAGRIRCPILMGIGLQDPTCPPHTNFAGYNLITTQKQFVIYPRSKHDTEHPDWDNRQWEFFKSFIRTEK